MKHTHLILLAVAAFTGLKPQAKAQAVVVDLGLASSFAVLASSGITNAGVTTISGDIGTSPTTTIDGGGSFNFVTGADHGNDTFTQNAQTALAAAYSDAAGRTGGSTVATELGATTLTPGVYNAGTFGITGTLTLNAQGNPNAVWIFQAGSTLTTAASSHVSLINSAQAANVFWQLGSSATLSGTDFSGSILAHDSITLTNGAMVDGRLLALGAHVTLDTNTISVPVGAIPEPVTTSVLIAGVVALVIGVHRIRRHRTQG